MENITINVVKKSPKDQKHPEYQYGYEIREVDGKVHDYRQSLNYLAQNQLSCSVVKVQNTLTKDYNAYVCKEHAHRYGSSEKSFAYFLTEEDANKAKDWMLSLIMSNQMVGYDNLRRMKKDKAAANHEKLVSKRYKDLCTFIDKKVKITVKNGSGNRQSILNFADEVLNVTRNGDWFTITTNLGEFKGFHSELKYTPTWINYYVDGHSFDIQI